MTMTRRLTVAAMCVAVAALTGCMSDKQTEQMAKGYSEFIHQERSMPLQSIEFTDAGGTITYTNVKRYETRAPLDKLSIMPENPSVVRELVDGGVRLGAIGAAAYGIHTLSDSGGSTTINNAAPVAP